MFARLFNSRGSTTMLALFVVGMVSTGVYLIANKIIVERKLASQLRKDIHANLALRSITDYVKYGIRKGWCFDDKLLPQAPAECVDNFENPNSSIRLMMPPSYAKTLENLGREHPTDFPVLAGKTSENIMLYSIQKQINFSTANITQSHPLFRIIANVRSHLVKGLKVKMVRVGNMTMPVNGDEVYLEITSEFIGNNGNVLQSGIEISTDDGENTSSGNQYFREVSRYVTNPREVNSFALMLPGSIYIGATPPEVGHGDLAIPQGTQNNIGMVFNSPVFVNENIILSDSGYTPVTFNDTVVIGNGIIKTTNGEPFSINDALGVKRYWTDLKTFGGFTRGIDSDGKRDMGLTVLNGASDSTTLNNDIITQCINIIRSQSDPEMTNNSRMVPQPTAGATLDDKLSEMTNRFSFSELANGALNMFVPQLIVDGDGGINYDSASNKNDLSKKYNGSNLDASNIWYSVAPAYNLASGTKLVMWAYMKWDGDKLKIPILENSIGDGHTVTINFSAYTKDEYEQGVTVLAAASATLNTRQVRLAALESLKPTNPVSFGAWALTSDGKEYGDLKASKYNDDSIAWAQERKDDVKEEHDKRKEYYQNPGKIEISSTKPNNGFTQRQDVFRNVTVKIINGKYFRKKSTGSTIQSGLKKTTLSPEEIKNFNLEGMDLSAVAGGFSTRVRNNQNRVTNDPSENSAADFNNVHFAFDIDNSNSDKPLVMSNKGRNYQNNVINLGTYKPLDVSVNYQALINQCFDSAGGTNLDAFKPASFASADFTNVAPDSWHFASPDPKTTYFNEDIVNSAFEFKIAAIRDTCTIHSSAKIVTGFYVCRNLNILSRSTRLDMIGTFIITKNISVHQTALSAGVYWSSIHNQQANASLKENNASGSPTLRRANNSNCASLYDPNVPFWHPDPGLNTLADRIRCSSTFLLQGKGPPRWTSVDPDCGRIGDSTNTQCLKRIRNYQLIELERIYGN